MFRKKQNMGRNYRKKRKPAMKTFSLIVCVVVLVLTTTFSFAGGGGGLTYGVYLHMPPYSNQQLTVNFFGGFGYGVNRQGAKIGGFGIAILDNDASDLMAGGFGGLITGKRLTAGPFFVSINIWSGFGGIGSSFGNPSSFFGLFLEGNVEFGIRLVPWMQLAVFAGEQVITNLIPGLPFVGNLVYTPVFGTRIIWGGF